MELWKPNLNFGSQGCHHEKVLIITPWVRTQAPCITSNFSLDHQSLIHNVPTKLSISRFQLREQIWQTKKWTARMTVLGSSESNNIFLNGTNISFLNFICEILNRDMANSFWNHIIQSSSRRMYFKDIYSHLWTVKIVSGNIYSLKSNTYFWGKVMFIQAGFYIW